MKKIEKEKAVEEFYKMIKQSWTWARLTQKERERFYECIELSTLFGTFAQRWTQLNDIYFSFLMGVGYSYDNWREEAATGETL